MGKRAQTSVVEGSTAQRKPRSRYYDGAPWAWLIDPLTSEVQDFVAAQIEPGVRVLDVGCGTGLLAIRLGQKAADVVGLELSPVMLAFANRRLAAVAAPDVSFVLGDAATYLATRTDGSFDTATMAFVLHEMPAEARASVLRESARVARRVICVDFMVPMPRSARGFFYRGIEVAGGPEHFRGFRDFGTRGGTQGIAASAGLSCRQLGTVLGACVDVSEVRR
jgi:SAM-dependent methyltransferase